MRSEPARTWPVAIVGGGFSGTMTALQLARAGVASVLIDGSGRLGRGVAYATREPAHVLNVISDKMSAWPDRTRDFADWIGDAGTGFAERRAFGQYLAEQLQGTEEVRPIDAMACEATRDGEGWRVRLSKGEELRASGLVLALGNQPPAAVPQAEGLAADLFINNPWSERADQAIERAARDGADVLILGTGLTMIDTVLSLDAAGHRGRITALSRRGLVPRAHVDPPVAPAPVALEDLPLGAMLPLWRWLRRRSAEVGFRAAVDSLRPHSHAIWRSLAPAEVSRFLRHARPWWDVHRHRIAPEVAARLKNAIGDARLEIMAGRLGSLQPAADGGLRATIRRRGDGVAERRVGLAFNCTGPLGDMRRTQDPLLAGLLQSGQVALDDYALGLEVDERSRAGERLWALGPMTKGRFWEITAVPDIRGQAAAVAAGIVAELQPR